MAAADFVLVPSRFEPCGLVAQAAVRYGAVPIVCAVGGLKDLVTPEVCVCGVVVVVVGRGEVELGRVCVMWVGGWVGETVRDGVEQGLGWQRGLAPWWHPGGMRIRLQAVRCHPAPPAGGARALFAWHTSQY